eukprot:1362102-Amorphochlora_amoeboformis.AAC.1
MRRRREQREGKGDCRDRREGLRVWGIERKARRYKSDFGRGDKKGEERGRVRRMVEREKK